MVREKLTWTHRFRAIFLRYTLAAKRTARSWLASRVSVNRCNAKPGWVEYSSSAFSACFLELGSRDA
jgi:hypothetical protein